VIGSGSHVGLTAARRVIPIRSPVPPREARLA
jgi:hypothetical protein